MTVDGYAFIQNLSIIAHRPSKTLANTYENNVNKMKNKFRLISKKASVCTWCFKKALFISI